MSEVFHIAQALNQSSTTPRVLATLVRVEGSSYRKPGARRLIDDRAPAAGSISGGCLEADLDQRARDLLNSTNVYDTVTYDTRSENDLLWGVGTGCHGVVQIFLEKITTKPAWVTEVLLAESQRRTFCLCTRFAAEHANRGTFIASKYNEPSLGEYSQVITPRPQLIIFGAGDDVIPLSELTNALDWVTHISDPRPEFAQSRRFPAADAVSVMPAEDAAANFNWDDWSAAVVMTHHYRFDLPLLKTLVPLRLPYLGLLGPRERGRRLLTDAGYDPSACDVHNPVGLDLGGDGPAAVAVAIVAEIQAKLHGRSAQPLRTRRQPIHADDGS